MNPDGAIWDNVFYNVQVCCYLTKSWGTNPDPRYGKTSRINTRSTTPPVQVPSPPPVLQLRAHREQRAPVAHPGVRRALQLRPAAAAARVLLVVPVPRRPGAADEARPAQDDHGAVMGPEPRRRGRTVAVERRRLAGRQGHPGAEEDG